MLGRWEGRFGEGEERLHKEKEGGCGQKRQTESKQCDIESAPR